MNPLILSMMEAIRSLNDGLEILQKECETANKNYIQQQHELLVSEFGKWTSSSDYEGKQEPLESEFQNLQRSFGMITQHAGELAGALHVYSEKIEDFYKVDASPAPPLPEVTVDHNMAASENAVDDTAEHNMDASDDAVEHNTAASENAVDDTVEHNMDASDDAVEHNMAASENAGEHSTPAHASHPGSA